MSAMQDEFKTLKLRAASLQKSPENNAPKEGVTTRKGVKKLNTYSKRQLTELSARFEGYKVLAAGEQDGKVSMPQPLSMSPIVPPSCWAF